MFTKDVPVEEGWVVDIRGIMFILKTVMNCIVFNLVGVYCHYMKLK